MHVGMAPIFQNPNHDQGVSDYEVYRTDLALAMRAESLGFESVWGVEHHFTDYTMSPDVPQLLAAVGGACKQVKLGTMVIVLPWNDPMRVAEKVSMLDSMTDGRVILGIGRGLARVEFEGLRVPMGESRERFVECAEAVLEGLENGYVEYDGQFIQQPRARIRPEPFRSFRNRSYAAAISPESSRIMARLGVGILIIPQKLWEDHARELAEYSRLYREMHGRAAPRPWVAGWVACHRDRAKAKDMAYKYIVGYWHSVMKHYELQSKHFAKTKGYEYYAQMSEQANEYGADAMAEMFMDLHVWGTPDDCIEKIADIHERTDCCGFSGVFSYAGMPADMANANMELFAREVMPAVKNMGTSPAFDLEPAEEPAFAAGGS